MQATLSSARTRRAFAIEPPPIDAAAGIFDHNRVETFAPRVFARIADAEIEREPGNEHAGKPAFAQDTR
jgi:hypothetical protein